MTKEIENTPNKKKSSWLKWLLGFIVVLVMALYFGRNYLPFEIPDATSFFKKEETSEMSNRASLPTTENEEEPLAVIYLDSLQKKAADSLMLDSVPIADSLMLGSVPIVDSMPVFTEKIESEDTLSTPTVLENEALALEQPSEQKDSFFTENAHTPDMAFDDSQIDTLTIDKHPFLQRNILSHKTVLSILAIIGKDFLLEGKSRDTEDLMSSILSEKTVKGILLMDKNGQIQYASNAKILHQNIEQVFPEWKKSDSEITWNQNENEWISSMPIYHTFGRIGTVILVTKKDEKIAVSFSN